MLTARRWAYYATARLFLVWTGALLLAGILLATVIVTIGHDEWSVRYQLWKAGLYNMDKQDVLATFYIDPNKDFVLGKSEAELSKLFGPLARPEDEGPYYRDFAREPRWKGKKIRYIKGTAWLIAFDRDKAVDLLLVKG